jgi:hypothetical protein
MKRWCLALISVAAMSFGLCACAPNGGFAPPATGSANYPSDGGGGGSGGGGGMGY